jgi:hypothetical protein
MFRLGNFDKKVVDVDVLLVDGGLDDLGPSRITCLMKTPKSRALRGT